MGNYYRREKIKFLSGKNGTFMSLNEPDVILVSLKVLSIILLLLCDNFTLNVQNVNVNLKGGISVELYKSDSQAIEVSLHVLYYIFSWYLRVLKISIIL